MARDKWPVMCVVLLALSLSVAVLPGRSAAEPAVPKALADWRDWVLHGAESHRCPLIAGGEGRTCVFPGFLQLDLQAQSGGRFVMEVTADAADWLHLPGDNNCWPTAVTLDGKPAVVTARNGRPALYLGTGPHRVAGMYAWTQQPDGLTLPDGLAHVQLTMDGAAVPFPGRDDKGRLWLKAHASSAGEADEVNVAVVRKIADGVPMIITAQIVLRVSGRARELTLEGALLPDTLPLSVSGDIPAKLDDSGKMRVQAQAGTHVIEVVARTAGNPASLALPPRVAPWPQEEFWAFAADEALRQVSLSGAVPTDPTRTPMSEDWYALPAFVVAQGAALHIETLRRGEPTPPPGRLSVHRNIWLDMGGEGYSVHDTLEGTLHQGGRLDLSRGILGQAQLKTPQGWESQLITHNPADGQAGVEIRQRDFQLRSDWRIEGSARELPAVSWSQDVQELSVDLHLPPGWRLLTARGVDDVSDTFWDNWNLFSFFFVLIMALAIGRLTHWGFGLLALVALALSYQEPDAPFFAWIFLLLTVALLRVLPQGRAHKTGVWLFWASVVGIAAVLAVFSVYQIRHGLYPQTGDPNSGISTHFAGMGTADAPSPAEVSKRDIEREEALAVRRPTGIPKTGMGLLAGAVLDGDASFEEVDGRPVEPEEERDVAAEEAKVAAGTPLQTRQKEAKVPKAKGALSRLSSSVYAYENEFADPKSVIQTGPGMPKWSWNTWQLRWSGPVGQAHSLKLYLLSPAVNLLLSILRVLLLVALCLRLVWAGKKTPPASDDTLSRMKARALSPFVSLGLLLALCAVPLRAHADVIPPDNLLSELRSRLLAPPICAPQCLENAALHVRLGPDGHLSLTAEVHAGAALTWPIPGPVANWSPQEIRIDGRKTDATRLMPDGFVHVRIPTAGRHQVTVTGPVPDAPSLTLEIPGGTRRVTQELDGWKLEGLRAAGSLESSLLLVRTALAKEDAAETERAGFEEGSYPPWFTVTRTLDVGVLWQVQTRVQRQSPVGTPLVVRIPLLPGESVVDEAFPVEAAHLVVSLGRNESEVSWRSTLPESPQMTLQAAAQGAWSEVWDIRCGRIWQCHFSGIAPVSTPQGDAKSPVQTTHFQPWPGETLTVDLQKPDGVKGQSTTVESANLRVSPGTRLMSAELAMRIRASRSHQQQIQLPPGAAVQSVTLDDRPHPYVKNGDALHINLEAGERTLEVQWQQEGGIRAWFSFPEVRIHGGAANVAMVCQMPTDRWLLWAGGVNWGPAVLFWGFLLAVLLAGLVLGRAKISPLKSWQWMLLLFGLTQVPIAVTMIIVVWFFAMARRAQTDIQPFWVHNIALVFMGIWTFVALVCLVGAVYQGLAVQPDMQVDGAGSSGDRLIWYADRVQDTLPMPWVLSVPLLVWKLLMLAWALWLALSTIQWAKWTWRSWSAFGLWRMAPPIAPLQPRPAPSPQPPTTPQSPPPSQQP